MARLKLPYDPGLDLNGLGTFLHARMADRYTVEPYGSRAVAVKSSEWYGVFAGVRQKPKKNETVVWITRGIPSNKRYLLIPLILITIWPYLIIFLILTSKAKPVEDEVRAHIEAAPKPLSGAVAAPPPAMPPPAAAVPPPPPPAGQ